MILSLPFRAVMEIHSQDGDRRLRSHSSAVGAAFQIVRLTRSLGSQVPKDLMVIA